MGAASHSDGGGECGGVDNGGVDKNEMRETWTKPNRDFIILSNFFFSTFFCFLIQQPSRCDARCRGSATLTSRRVISVCHFGRSLGEMATTMDMGMNPHHRTGPEFLLYHRMHYGGGQQIQQQTGEQPPVTHQPWSSAPPQPPGHLRPWADGPRQQLGHK